MTDEAEEEAREDAVAALVAAENEVAPPQEYIDALNAAALDEPAPEVEEEAPAE